MKTFIVLGMHRSATSLAAKGLHECGIHVGDRLIGKHDSNIYGHFEDVEFVHLNDVLLKEAGGSWCNPPPEEEIVKVGRKYRKVIEDFIIGKRKEPFWGWKDPRTTLTIECFLPYLQKPHYIVCFRNPLDVARSLKKRDGIPIDKGIKLTAIYNSRLLSFLARQTDRRRIFNEDRTVELAESCAG